MLLGVVCILVLITNFLGRQDMDHLGNSFSSVYKDRLMVEGYIYELSGHLYQKKILVDHYTEQSSAQVEASFHSHNDAINRLLSDYAQTQLTKEEAECFGQFSTEVATLQTLEQNYLQIPRGYPEQVAVYAEMNTRFAAASEQLQRLSKIQMTEGKMLSDQSKRIIDLSTLFRSVEMVALIGIAVLLQVLVLAGKPLISRIKQQGQWN